MKCRYQIKAEKLGYKVQYNSQTNAYRIIRDDKPILIGATATTQSIKALRQTLHYLVNSQEWHDTAILEHPTTDPAN